MTPKRKPLSGLARLLKSHLRLLRVHRGQIQELGELRKAILDMRQSVSVLRRMAQETRELMAQRPAPQEYDVPPADAKAKADYAWFEKNDYEWRPPNDWPRL